jgi:hypothetical protein
MNEDPVFAELEQTNKVLAELYQPYRYSITRSRNRLYTLYVVYTSGSPRTTKGRTEDSAGMIKVLRQLRENAQIGAKF